ncbi:unnamed protein product [Rotaria socialis]|uniref:C2H2-type domain-containing protein n=1 Tax=Rotaria socialis TaxID=392032 RepID=A0A818ENB1_9BILA|nr:unnamed protein product [Rotaria socialis]
MSLNRVNLVDYNSPSTSSSTQRVLHCTICNIYPRSLQAYVEHLDIRHRDEEVEVACPVDGCDEAFPSVARFKIHIRKIHSTPTNTKSSTATSGLLSSSNTTTIRTNNDIDEASSDDDDDDTHRRNSYLKRPKLDGKRRFGTVSRMTKLEPNDSMEYGLKSEDEFADIQFEDPEWMPVSERRGTLYTPNMSLMGEDEESGSAMTPVSRSGGRVRCYAPIPHPPQLPELSERVQACLENGQAAQVLQEFINETAEFFMKTYPQLKTGREYRKIGLALIKKYPCLAEKGNHLKPEALLCRKLSIKMRNMRQKIRAKSGRIEKNDNRIHQNNDAYYDAITAKLRQIQGQVQYSTLYKQYLSKTHTRRREWLSNNADLNLYGILQELPFMAGKEFLTGEYGLLRGRHISSFSKTIGLVLDILTKHFTIRKRENMDLTYRLCLMQLCRALNCNFIIQNKQTDSTKGSDKETDDSSHLRLTVMDFVNGTSSYFLFYGRKPLCELATGQGMLKQALLLFLVTFEVYMVEIPEEYYEAVSLLRVVVFGNVYENEVPESTEAQRLIAIIEDVSLCDRLKQRYGIDPPNPKLMLHDPSEKKHIRDIDFIRYIVNFIIEQAKHNIVISELPDVIRTLHSEAQAIIENKKKITLDEAILHVQTVGAMKYPYLKNSKPICAEDFVKEVIREVFNRLGTTITLDMIEDICRFTTCSTKQLLDAMPQLDVHEAARLIMEDISRNQFKIKENQIQLNIHNTPITLNRTIKEKTALLSSSSMTQMYKSIPDITKRTSSPTSNVLIKSEGQSSELVQNSNQTHRKPKLPEHNDLTLTSTTKKLSNSLSVSHRSSKKSMKNERNQSSNQTDSIQKRLLKLKHSKNQLTEILKQNPLLTVQQRKLIKCTKPVNISSSSLVSSDTHSKESCPLALIKQKVNFLLESYPLDKNLDRKTRKKIMKNFLQEYTRNQNQETSDSTIAEGMCYYSFNQMNFFLFRNLTDQRSITSDNRSLKIKLPEPNTKTYSIRSEQRRIRRPSITSTCNMSNINNNVNAFIKPTKSLKKISRRFLKRIFSHTESYTNIVPFSNGLNDLKENVPCTIKPIRHYGKHCNQHSGINNNE